MNKSLLLASLIAVAALAACGKKEEAAPVAPAPAVTETPAVAAPEASAAMDAASAAADAASAAASAASM
jgi:hypothetical protein